MYMCTHSTLRSGCATSRALIDLMARLQPQVPLPPGSAQGVQGGREVHAYMHAHLRTCMQAGIHTCVYASHTHTHMHT